MHHAKPRPAETSAWHAGWWAGLAVGLVTGAALVVLLLPSTPSAARRATAGLTAAQPSTSTAAPKRAQAWPVDRPLRT